MSNTKANSKETRYTTGKVEVRASDDGSEKRTISGYAAKFNEESELMYGSWVEIIEPGAFDDVMEDDVRALFNHDGNLILARTKSGTLTLSVDEIGLKYEFEVPNTQAGKDLVISIERGDVDQSSFAFQIASGGSKWERIENEDNSVKEVRRITKVKRLFDVSPVTYPAYPSTDVAVRSYEKWKEGNQEGPPTPSVQSIRMRRKRLELKHKNNS